jgi:hypothetical protein
VLYRKSFEQEAVGDDIPLAELEQRFMSMATRDDLDEAERRARLDAIRETYLRENLPEMDRTYFTQLAVAKLVREQAVKPGDAAPKPPEPTPLPEPVPDDGPLPAADDDGGSPIDPEDPLPSLE